MDDLRGGEQLEDALKAAGLEQKELAAAIDVAPSTVSAWVNGVNTPPAKRTERIAEALGKDPDEVRAWFGYGPRAASARGRAGLVIGSRASVSAFESDADYMSAAEFAEFVTANADKLSAADRRRTAELIVRFLETGEGGEEIQP